RPIVAAIDMGYGHLRAAAPLADALGVPMLRMDLPPLGDARDAWFWRRTRAVYEPLTRWSQIGLVGAPLRALLGRITAIPEGGVDLSAPTAGTRWMERAARGGAGRALAEHLRRTRAPLLSTFYAAPILAELHGAERLHCVVTDADVNRVWAPPDPARSRIRYYVPSEPALRRIESYGVAPGAGGTWRVACAPPPPPKGLRAIPRSSCSRSRIPCCTCANSTRCSRAPTCFGRSRAR